MKMIAGGGLSITGSHTMCGDYLYSGHTVMLTLTYLFIKECKSLFVCAVCAVCVKMKEDFTSKPHVWLILWSSTGRRCVSRIIYDNVCWFSQMSQSLTPQLSLPSVSSWWSGTVCDHNTPPNRLRKCRHRKCTGNVFCFPVTCQITR